MKTIIRATFFALLVALINAGPGFAEVTFPPKPESDSMISDTIRLIDKTEYDQINLIAFKLFNEEQIPLYIVTIDSMAHYGAYNYSIEGYAEALFNEWGIGSPERNYGILLLISQKDRKARIELGADWGRDHDVDARRVMQTLIVPQFKKGYFSLGILDGARGIDSMARGLALPKPTAPWWVVPAMIVAAIFFVALIYNLFKTGRSGWAWALIVALGLFLLYVMTRAPSGGGSGGGFGGGFSGGGGATGSW